MRRSRISPDATMACLLLLAAAPYTLLPAARAQSASGSSQVTVLLEKHFPAEVRAGEAFEYTIRVANTTGQAVSDVVVSDALPAGFTMSGSTPPANATEGGRAAWNVGRLGSGESRTIRVSGKVEQAGRVEGCARVSFAREVCAATTAVQPALKLVKTLPERVQRCDVIPMRLVVTNTGTGTARGVTIVDDLPEGLVGADGGRRLSLQVGDLGAGASRTLHAQLRANRTGRFDNTAVASSTDGLKADAQAAVTVVAPVLQLTKTAPGKRYLGRPIRYEITVSNSGDGPAANTIIEDALGAGVRFISASDGGQAAGNRVTWRLGTIEPGASRKLTLTVQANAKGTVRNTASARAACADPVNASADTVVAGIPAILLEVIDVEDPIEVGGTITYAIRVVNQGSAVGTNIALTCQLEDAMSYVSGTGPTPTSADGRTITLAPLPTLAPKATAEWRLVIKALKAGDIRFSVTMTSDQIDRPVAETESTHLYE